MDISRLSAMHQLMTSQIQSQQTMSKQVTQKNNINFGDLFTQQIKDTNQFQHNADMELQSFMMGESENIHDVMIAMEEATIALELTTQVRNKLVDSYQELKNMQI